MDIYLVNFKLVTYEHMRACMTADMQAWLLWPVCMLVYRMVKRI